MSAAPATGRAARFAAKLAATETRLQGVTLPGGGGWLGRARAAALARVRAMGLPERRDEYWRFTDPARLTAAEVPEARVFRPVDEKVPFADVDRLRLVFVDGVFAPDESDDPVLAGVEISRLAEIGAADIHWAQELFGTLETAGQSPVARPLAALNTALATDGLVIRVGARAQKPINIVHRRTSASAEARLHHVLRLEPGAQLTLLENGPIAARYFTTIEIDLADDAVLHHVRLQGRDHERNGISHVFARVAANARLKSFTLTANGAVQRNEAVVWLKGRGGSAHLAGAALGDGTFHHDDTVFVAHCAPQCESRQVFKKVLRHGAVGVFQGKILVEQPAQLTDGYQLSQSLLIDEDCQFLAKPELEIYADDVKCSHGSTSGEIDADQLYYLRARGISKEDAKNLLVLAFLAEALDEIEDADLAEDIRERLAGWLHRHRT